MSIKAFRLGGRAPQGLKPSMFRLNAGLKAGSSTRNRRSRIAPPQKSNNSCVIDVTFFIGPEGYDPRMDRTFFITSVTAQRRTLFQRVAVCDLLVDVLQHYRSQGKYLLHDFVIMPDHFHALITPAPEISLEKAVQFIKGGFSFRLRSKLPVWQPSFTNHRIRDAEDFERHREYVRMNPVRAGLVESVEVYPYSSASGKFALDPMPPGLKPSLEWGRTPA